MLFEAVVRLRGKGNDANPPSTFDWHTLSYWKEPMERSWDGPPNKLSKGISCEVIMKVEASHRIALHRLSYITKALSGRISLIACTVSRYSLFLT
jgi:hypothetical protein